jgi:hypothetical protein
VVVLDPGGVVVVGEVPAHSSNASMQPAASKHETQPGAVWLCEHWPAQL